MNSADRASRLKAVFLVIFLVFCAIGLSFAMNEKNQREAIEVFHSTSTK